MRGFNPTIFNGINAGSNFILLVFGMYFTLVLFRSQMIERVWALRWGLIFLGISVFAPLISSLVMTSQLASPSPYRGGGVFSIMLTVSLGCIALSCVLCIASMLPRLVYVRPERTQPVRNPFED